MKLLLTSGGLMNQSIISALKDLCVRDFSELNLAFIPTAANLEEGDKWWLIQDLEACKKLGLKQLDIVDISALPQQVWKKRLEEADILLFSGGNTYHLMHWLNVENSGDIIKEMLKTKIYVGVSAGSLVATPNISNAGDEKESVTEIGEEAIEKGLDLVDFMFEPHINNKHFPDRTFEKIEKEASKMPYTVYALDDQSAIKVNGESVEVITEGEWKKFN